MRVTVTDSEGNSTVLKEDYIRYERPTYSDSITYVEEGTVFVMGDNRSDSSDSRSMRIGLVDTRRILGRVIVRVTPFSRFGTVD
jgi:signal peptidase I